MVYGGEGLADTCGVVLRNHNQTRRAPGAPVIPLLCSRTASHVVCTFELCHGQQEEACRSALHLSITAPLTWLFDRDMDPAIRRGFVSGPPLKWIYPLRGHFVTPGTGDLMLAS
jgi:hypothetical protein